MDTKITLVRHGAVHNPDKLYYGRLPRFGLAEIGRKQAANTAQFLTDQAVDHLYSSPLLRARQTAGIIGERLGLPVRYSKRLLEVYTPHDGRTLAEMEAQNWDLYTGSPPEFEQMEDVVGRMVQFINQKRRQHPNQHTIAVSHADPLALTTLWAADKPRTLHNRERLHVAGLPVRYPKYACAITFAFVEHGDLPVSIDFFAPEQ